MKDRNGTPLKVGDKVKIVRGRGYYFDKEVIGRDAEVVEVEDCTSGPWVGVRINFEHGGYGPGEKWTYPGNYVEKIADEDDIHQISPNHVSISLPLPIKSEWEEEMKYARKEALRQHIAACVNNGVDIPVCVLEELLEYSVEKASPVVNEGDGEWVMWNPSPEECNIYPPLLCGTRVEVVKKDGDTNTGEVQTFDWDNDDCTYDIVRYRVLKGE